MKKPDRISALLSYKKTSNFLQTLSILILPHPLPDVNPLFVRFAPRHEKGRRKARRPKAVSNSSVLRRRL
jgi:hypothetical protein